MLQYANDSTGRIVSIWEVKARSRQKWICDKCGGLLEAVKGNEREHHFRHVVEIDCDGATEGTLHYRGKMFFLSRAWIFLRGNGWTYDLPLVEQPLGAFRPDVTIRIAQKPVYVEIFVKSACKEEKDSHFRTKQLNSVEIDLSDLPYNIDDDALEEALFHDTQNKRIIYWDIIPENVSAPASTSEIFWNNLIEGIGFVLLAVAALVFIRWLFSSKKK
jgi:hypothetical protein